MVTSLIAITEQGANSTTNGLKLWPVGSTSVPLLFATSWSATAYQSSPP